MDIGSSLARLAGGRTDVFRYAPRAQLHYVAVGGALISAAASASVSAAVGLHLGLGLTWPVSVVIGVCWGGVILCLDRMLVVSATTTRRLGVKLAVTAPRLLIALAIGIIVSQPLTLSIFHSEVTAQLAVDHTVRIQQYSQSVAAESPTIDRLTTEQTELENIIQHHGTPSVAGDPAVQTATRAYDQANATYLQLAQAAQCELDGTCGTHQPGAGPNYLSTLQAADIAATNLADARLELGQVTDAAIQSAIASAPHRLATVQNELTAARVEQQGRTRALTNAVNGDNGLLAQLSALQHLAAGNTTIRWAELLLFALFVSVELFPVLVTLFTSLGPRSLYERLVERAEAEADLANRLNIATERKIAAERANARVDLARAGLADEADALSSLDDELELFYAQHSAGSIEFGATHNAVRAATATVGLVLTDDEIDRLITEITEHLEERTVHPLVDVKPDSRTSRSGRLAGRRLWQAFTDGLGGIFDVGNATRVKRPALPSFESILAGEVHRQFLTLRLDPHAADSRGTGEDA